VSALTGRLFYCMRTVAQCHFNDVQEHTHTHSARRSRDRLLPS